MSDQKYQITYSLTFTGRTKNGFQPEIIEKAIYSIILGLKSLYKTMRVDMVVMPEVKFKKYREQEVK